MLQNLFYLLETWYYTILSKSDLSYILQDGNADMNGSSNNRKVFGEYIYLGSLMLRTYQHIR